MTGTDPGLTAGFVRRVQEVHGPAGAAWIERLPAILADCQRRWSLTLLDPFPGLTYNYVRPALRSDGTPVVLKAGVPHPELLSEIEALRLFAGRGAVTLLDAVPEQGALLLERLLPGTPLSSLADDEQATAIAGQVMARLWRPVPAEHSFPTVAGWAGGLLRLRARFDGGTGPLPTDLVERAESTFADLLATMAEPVLLQCCRMSDGSL